METPDKQTDMSAMTRLEVADVVGKAVTLGFMDACDLTIGKDNQKTGREVAAALGITHARIGHFRGLRHAYMLGWFHFESMGKL